MLCCGSPKHAYQAILRLQHGLRADSAWIDPDVPEFDPQAIIRDFQQWQYQPFVEFVLDIRQQPLDHPYDQERLAALKAWVDSGAYRAVVERPTEPPSDRLIEVVRIQAFDLAAEGQTIDPDVVVSDGQRQILRTRTGSALREAQWKGFRPAEAGVDQPRSFEDGRPLFFEIWDDNSPGDTLVGGFAIDPDGREAGTESNGERTAESTARILWDGREPRAVSRPGHARVQVRFTRRQISPGGAPAKGAKR